jgi:hypothetical protein
MDNNYIEAIRAAAAHGPSPELQPMLEFILGMAAEDYKSGALGLLEFDEIATECADILRNTNAINYT